MVYIDGTGDSPGTNVEDGNRAPTNIQRMHEMSLSDEDIQASIYIRGLATGNGLWDEKFLNALEFNFGAGAEEKRDDAYLEISTVFEANDTLYLFGFSRGAAIARDLANYIVEHGLNGQSDVNIEMMGLFDCVASFGIPIDILGLPTQRINLGKKLKLPEQVKSAYHLVAIHEPRSGFEPTLVAPRYQELWFAGTHKDIGGGYVERGMADLTLRYMMQKASDHGVVFNTEEHLSIDPVIPGNEMYLFRETGDDKSDGEIRQISVGRYGKSSDKPVKLHSSIPYWERMNGNTIPLENIEHIYVD